MKRKYASSRLNEIQAVTHHCICAGDTE